jgi:hypothetical protein
MVRRSFLLPLLIAGCSKGPQADLPAIGEARSLAAEWALVNEQASSGQLNATYTRTMREQLRHQLETNASALTRPDSRYGEEIHILLAQPEDAPADELSAHAAVLKQIEDGLESA